MNLIRLEKIEKELKCSIKILNKKIWILRKELREKNKEIKEIEELTCRRKTIDDKRELQGLMRVRWSGKGKENKRSKNLNIIIIVY